MLFFLDHNVHFNQDSFSFIVPDFLGAFVDPNTALVIVICSLIVILAPIVALIYWGLKLVLRFQANDRLISVIAGIAWLLSGIILVGVGFMEAKKFAFSTNVEEYHEFAHDSTKVLYLRSSEGTVDYSEIEVWDNDLDIYMKSEETDRLFIPSDITIRKTKEDKVRIEVEKEARGESNRSAIRNAGAINFNWSIEGNQITIDPFFELENSKLYHFPDVDVVIYLPYGMEVCIDQDLVHSINYVESEGYYWNDEVAGKCFVMKENGLVRSDNK